MAEALVSIILEQLASITRQQIEGEVKLVVGVDDDVPELTRNFQAIQTVLEDAESRQFRDDAVRYWLDRLQYLSYDIDDVLDEWNTSIGKLHLKGVENAMIKKVCSIIPCYRFRLKQVVLRHDIALKIKYLNKSLDVIATEKNMFRFSLKEGTIEKSTVEIERPVTTSIIDISEVQGRNDDKHTLFMKLLSESHEEPAISIISIVGMGGTGKTTLAQLAFNDDNVKSHFDKRIWVCVSKPFDEMRIAKMILESLVDNASKIVELENVLQKISQSLEKKKFFLVLDDVWIEDTSDWEQLMSCLKSGSKRSRILVTTRKEKVAYSIGTKITNIISLGTLSNEESWLLFSQVAFFERTKEECEKLKDIGREIIGKCNGLPLAIKTLGSLLRFKTNIEQWQGILDSEMWELEEIERGVFPPLLLSYYDLPSMLKKCFSYCAIFPKYYEIEKDKLIKLWMSQNYLKEEGTKDMELIGKEYFENLAMRSFFQDFKKNEFDGSIECCRMHDIVHDFAQFLTKNECFTLDVEKFIVPFSYKDVQHLEIQLGRKDSFPMSIYNEKKLRSLIVKGESISSKTLSQLYDNFTCLRRLDLTIYSIEKIARNIKKLIHLRYLDFSRNDNLKELPEDLCELYNLQTLNVSFCGKLVNLPQGMEKLINFRHLINSETWRLSYMPKGIERLTDLRTLTELKLSSSSRHDEKAFSIECLENLNNLGPFNIWELGNVIDVDKVKRANLKNKRNLLSLGLYFENYGEVERRNDRNDETVLEALEPPLNLVKLYIRWYEGKSIWPHWMISLTQLKELSLHACMNCEYLPPLGRLSSLESLSIDCMFVERVGNEFLGIESENAASSFIAFPKLQNLTFSEMYKWEEWDIRIERNENITIMPFLTSLKICWCDKLKQLPYQIRQTSTLKQLEIKWCSILEKSDRKTYRRRLA